MDRLINVTCSRKHTWISNPKNTTITVTDLPLVANVFLKLILLGIYNCTITRVEPVHRFPTLDQSIFSRCVTFFCYGLQQNCTNHGAATPCHATQPTPLFLWDRGVKCQGSEKRHPRVTSMRAFHWLTLNTELNGSLLFKNSLWLVSLDQSKFYLVYDWSIVWGSRPIK